MSRDTFTVTCPNCQTAFPLDATLAQPFVAAERARLQAELRERDAAVRRREQLMAEQGQHLQKLRGELARREADITQSIELAVTDRLQEQRENLRQEVAAEQAERWAIAAAEQDVLREMNAKLREVQDALETKNRNLELEVDRRIGEACQKVREQTQKEEYQSYGLKLAECDKVIADMRKQVEELRRKAEQGSQRLQGEVQELELETMLRSAFPGDQITPVAKGRPGADVVQRVIGPGGLDCGVVLWESKRTKAWSNEWLPKNREDQRQVGAHLGVVVTTAMPPGVETFDRLDGVWVATMRCAPALAKALRQVLIETAIVKHIATDQGVQQEKVIAYLMSTRFRQRVAAIVEGCMAIQVDLEAEKRFLARCWSKRQLSVDLIMTGTAGVYGDFQGLIGNSMPQVEGLHVPMLDDSSDGVGE